MTVQNRFVGLMRWTLGLAGTFVTAMACQVSAVENSAPFLLARSVDSLLESRWQEAGINPSAECSDEQFMRRVYLDLLGRIPRISEARDFLDNRDPDRRGQLIDELVRNPSHATRLTNLWRLFLLPLEADVAAAASSAGFEAWLRERFATNTPYDEIARELLLAEGNASDTGPALYYTAWDLKPEKLAGSTARALLGIQIQCAECHDHPFDKWTQKDFWGYAAFFGQLQPLDQQQPSPGFKEALEGEVRLPGTEEVVPPRYPAGNPADDPRRSRREQLALWVTQSENPFFAAAAVNRVWFMLFGRGLVDPPDDIGKHNPSPHTELLQQLAQAFQDHHYDVRWLVQTLCRTRVYQCASATNDDPQRAALFADMHLKVLTAEQLFDSLNVAVCQPQESAASGPTFGINRTIDTTRQMFLSLFRSPTIGVTDYRLGISQALTLLNGAMVDTDTSLDRSSLLSAIDAPFFDDEQRVEILFLAVLSRVPQSPELIAIREEMRNCRDHQETREFLSDLLWALLNSGEFVLNR